MIYYCGSAKWKRLTSARPAGRAEQFFGMSSRGKALSAIVNEWASDEEMSRVRQWRNLTAEQESMYLKELLRTLQVRHGDVWLSGFKNAAVVQETGKAKGRPLIGLARAVLRIRLTLHHDTLQYDMDGLLRVLQARCMLGVLEHRIRVYLLEVRVGAKPRIRDKSKLQLSRSVDSLADRGLCDDAYRDLLKMLISSCRSGKDTVKVGLAVFCAIPALSLGVRSEDSAVEQYMDRMPLSLATAPVYKRMCWHCKKIAVVSLKCGSCKRARYCSRSCQRQGWKEHKPECSAIASFLTKELMTMAYSNEVREDDVWESFLHEHLSHVPSPAHGGASSSTLM